MHKRFTRRFFEWATAVLFVLVWALPAPAVCDVNESEPNNSFTQAQDLDSNCLYTSAGQQIFGEISTPNDSDVDMFRFEGPFYPGHTFDVVLEEVGDWDPDVGIFTENSRLLIVLDHTAMFMGSRNNHIALPLRDTYPALILAIAKTPGVNYRSGAYHMTVKDITGSMPELRPQRVLFDFNGAQNIQFYNLGNIPDLENSWLGANYPGQVNLIKNQILEKSRQDFAGLDVDLYSTDGVLPEEPYSRVYFGGYNEALLGVADNVDEYNADPSQVAIVFVETFEAFGGLNPNAEEIATALANVASHEAGHLLGLVHTENPRETMDVTASMGELLLDQSFNYSPIFRLVYPTGSQDAPYLLRMTTGYGDCIDFDDVSYPPGHVSPSQQSIVRGLEFGRTFSRITGVWKADYCDSSGSHSIWESYCLPDGSNSWELMDCPLGSICFDGGSSMLGDYCGLASTCTDSDFSLNPPQSSETSLSTRGMVEYWETQQESPAGHTTYYYDSCANNIQVVEYYCSLGLEYHSATVSCPSGKVCNNGKCEAPSSTPAAPLNLHAANLGSTSVVLGWDPAPLASGYQVYKNGVFYASADGAATTAPIVGLVANTSYSFSIKACNTVGCSGTTQYSVSTFPNLPAATQNLHASMVGATFAMMGWNDSPDETLYHLYLNGSIYSNPIMNQTSMQISNLAPGVNYQVGIQACIMTGCGPIQTISVTTKPCASGPDQLVAAITPVSINGQIGTSYAMSGVNSAPQNMISNYIWYFSDSGTYEYSPAVSHVFSQAGAHQVFMKVVDGCNNYSNWTGIVANISNPSAPIPCPGNHPPVAAMANYSYFDVDPGFLSTVQASPSYDPDGQVLDYRLLIDGLTNLAWQASPYINHMWTEAEIGNRTIEVEVRDSCGAISISPPAIVYVRTPTPPLAPTGFQVTEITSNSVLLTWNDTKYEDYYFVFINGNFYIDSEVTADKTAHLVGNLLPSTNYTFTIKACNSQCSAIDGSVTRTATTLPLIIPPSNPTGLAASQITTSSIGLQWLSGGGSVDFYQIKMLSGTVPPSSCVNGAIVSGTTKLYSGLSANTAYSFRVCAWGGSPLNSTSGTSGTFRTLSGTAGSPSGSSGVDCPSKTSSYPQTSVSTNCSANQIQ